MTERQGELDSKGERRSVRLDVREPLKLREKVQSNMLALLGVMIWMQTFTQKANRLKHLHM